MLVSFCYIGNQISSGGRCLESIVAGLKIERRKFRELLSLLTTKGFSSRVEGRLYDVCVQMATLHYSET